MNFTWNITNSTIVLAIVAAIAIVVAYIATKD